MIDETKNHQHHAHQILSVKVSGSPQPVVKMKVHLYGRVGHGSDAASPQPIMPRNISVEASVHRVARESPHGESLIYFCGLVHRACADFRAFSLRCSSVSFSADALPPLRPSATAAGFFFLAMSRQLQQCLLANQMAKKCHGIGK